VGTLVTIIGKLAIQILVAVGRKPTHVPAPVGVAPLLKAVPRLRRSFAGLRRGGPCSISGQSLCVRGAQGGTVTSFVSSQRHSNNAPYSFKFHQRYTILGMVSVFKKQTKKYIHTFFDVLLTVHLSIFISVFNQLDAQNFVSQ